MKKADSSAGGKTLTDAALRKKFGELQAKATKDWWSTVSPEERKMRAEKASKARWAKKS